MSIRGFGLTLPALLIFVAGGCADTSVSDRRAGAAAPAVDVSTANLRTLTLTVPDMACPLCANSIRAQLHALGVRGAMVDLKAKLVTGRFDPGHLTPDAIRDRGERSGFRVTEVPVQ